jgi:large subunit ribosomal protein L10
MDKGQKEALRKEVVEMFAKSQAAIVAEYRGLTVEQMTNLRREVRKANGQFKIVKNRIAKKAIELEVPEFASLSGALKGPIGVAYFFQDAAVGAKSMLKFEAENEKFVITQAMMGKELVGKSELKAISELPSKEVLIGKILGSITAPHRGLVTALSGVSRNLVQVINAIKEGKSA